MNDQDREMMDDFDRWTWRLLKMMVVAILLILYLLAVAWWISSETDNGDMMRHRVPVIQPSEPEKRWIEKRHKHHGIASSMRDRATGESYFYRKGKRCKL